MILQHRTYCKFKRTIPKNGEETKSEILVFHFFLGPIRLGCIVNVPRGGRESAPVYIQMTFHPDSKEWTEKLEKEE